MASKKYYIVTSNTNNTTSGSGGTCNHSAWEVEAKGLGVQEQGWLHSELQVSQGYRKTLSLKNNKR